MTTDRPGPATIEDVARAAGVSRATVSRVVNGRTTRETEVAQRVREAVERLGYEPSASARSLSLGVTHTVAMVVPDLGNPMFQQVLQGFNRAAAAAGYQVLVSDAQEVPTQELPLLRAARRRCDAVVVCSPRMPHADLRDQLSVLAPAVCLNRSVDVPGVPEVCVDYEGGARAAAAHLAALGHRRIAYLQGPAQSSAHRARLRGLRSAAREHPAVELVHLPCGATLDDGYQAWPDVERSGATGVLAFNDVVALGLLGRLGELGVDVPGRLSLVGFDDVAFSRFSHPPLTTMHVDHDGMGLAAWRQLQALLQGEPARATTVFVPQLVLRGTTGRPG